MDDSMRIGVTAPTLDDILPTALPGAMVEIANPVPSLRNAGQRWWKWGDLSVCVSLDDCGREGLWLHTSVSARRGRELPTWYDLARVKDAVHGDRLVVQILPPRAEYVNFAEVLHLWERLDAPTIPERVVSPRGGR